MASAPEDEPTPLQLRTFKAGEWPRKKTVDIGRNGVTVSADPFGGIYQISSKIRNDAYAIMIAAPWEQFDPKYRCDPQVVREFRKHLERRLLNKEPGLGLRLDMAKGHATIRHVNESFGSHVQIEYQNKPQEIFVRTALRVLNDGLIVQAIQINNLGHRGRELAVSLDLSFAVSRASYGQLTDQGEVPMPKAANAVFVQTLLDESAEPHRRETVCFENDSLGARLNATVVFYNNTTKTFINLDKGLLPGQIHDPSPPSMLRQFTAQEKRTQSLLVGPHQTLTLGCVLRAQDLDVEDNIPPCVRGAFDFRAVLDPTLFSHEDGIHETKDVLARYFKVLAGMDTRSEIDTFESAILWANIDYIIGCCSVLIDEKFRSVWAVIPDHIALPLGWPRDNYWQLRLLSKFHTCKEFKGFFPGRPAKQDDYSHEIQIITSGHIGWLFHVATTRTQTGNETRNFWRRSYLVNGRPKDGTVYQLDTQLYPFLQLCDYYRDLQRLGLLNEDHTEFVWSVVESETFCKVLMDILDRQDPDLHLFKTEETPADDDTRDFPFNLSSNILAWHTITQLAEMLGGLGAASPHNLWLVARDVREGIFNHLVCQCADNSGQQMFAYGLDPSKPGDDPARHRRYHDGNDMPTVFALEWGFVREPDQRRVWQNTLDWAFTPDPNWTVDPATRERTPGYNSGYAGNGTEPFHGLGSDHSEGPWTLGYFQEWKYARLVGDKKREAKAWARIKGSMQWDGTFSEAVDVLDGKCTSKTWFSWPGAMIAAELVETVAEQMADFYPVDELDKLNAK